MQTHKKHMKHVKHAKNTKKHNVSKNNRHFICHKIHFNKDSHDGHHEHRGGKTNDYDENTLVKFLNEYLTSMNGRNQKTHKYLNDMLNYHEEPDIIKHLVSAIKEDMTSKEDITSKEETNDTFEKTNDFENIGKSYYRRQLLDEISKKLKMNEYFEKEQNEQKEEEKQQQKQKKYEELTEFLTKKANSTEVVDAIKTQLQKLVKENKITQSKAKSILNQLNGVSIIGTSFARMNESVLKNAKYLGNWLSPAISSDSDDPNAKKENEQTVKFLWYPRKHVNYKKGNSTPKGFSKDDTYGDFMIYIDSPKYADIGEYFEGSYNSVEDLLANILLGCTDMFCTQGRVKPTFYNSRLFIINDKTNKKDN